MNRTGILLLLLLTLSLYCATATAGGTLRLDLVGVSPGMDVSAEGAAEGFVLEAPAWEKNDERRRRRLWAVGPEGKDREYRPFHLSFRVSRPTVIHLTIQRQRSGKEDNVYPYVAVRNLRASNAVLNPEKWERQGGELTPVEETPAILLAGGKETLLQKFHANPGKTITIRGEYRMADASDLLPAKEPVAFRVGEWELRIDPESGAWRSLRHRGRLLVAGGTFRLDLDAPVRFRLADSRLDEAAGTLTLGFTGGNFRLEERLLFSADWLERHAAFRFDGEQPEKFRGFHYRYALPEEGDYLLPGTFFYSNQGIWSREHWKTGDPASNRAGKFSALPAGGTLQAPGYIKLALIRPQSGPSLLFLNRELQESGIFRLRGGKPAQLELSRSISGWAEPGVTHTLDPLLMTLADEEPENTLRSRAPELLRSAGFAAPADRPAWLARASVYGVWFNRWRNPAMKDLPAGEGERARMLGFDTLYLPPLASGPHAYTPMAPGALEPSYGTWGEYREAVATLRGQGLRVIQDIVPHGGYVPTVAESCFLESGDVLWGRGADFNHPGWNRKLAEEASMYSRMGVAGFRVDAPAGSSVPNWRRRGFPADRPGWVRYADRYRKDPGTRPVDAGEWSAFLAANGGETPPLEYGRASQSGTAGGLRVSASIREAARSVDPESVTLLETHGLPFSSRGDLCYDILWRNLPAKLAGLPAGEFVRRLSLWLEEAELTDAPGTLPLRNYVMNDDRVCLRTVGPGAARALIALMYFARGVPLGYTGMDLGHAPFFTRLNRLRAESAALAAGAADYRQGASSDPKVFTVLRTQDDETVLGAINFSPEPVTFSLTLPAGKPLTRDLLTGRAIRTSAVTLGPWRSLLLAAAPRPAAAPALPAPPEPDAPRLDGDAIRCNRYVLRFDRKTGLPVLFTDGEGKTLLADVDLMTSADAAPDAVRVEMQSDGEGVTLNSRYEFPGGGTVSLSWRCRPEEVELKSESRGIRAALLLPAPAQEEIQAETATGLWEDRVTPVYAAAAKSMDSHLRADLRLPEDDTLLYDSRQDPLHPQQPELRLFPAAGTGPGLALAFGGEAPALQLHRQFNGRPGIHALLELSGERSVRLRPAAARLTEDDAPRTFRFGGVTLTAESIFWRVENEHFTARLSRRGGVLAELTDRKSGETLVSNCDLIREQENAKPELFSMDHESALEISGADNRLRLKFTGELRESLKSSSPLPLESSLEYRFDASPGFDLFCELLPVSGAVRNPRFAFSGRGDGEAAESEIRFRSPSGALLRAVASDARATANRKEFRFSRFDRDGVMLPGNRYRMAMRWQFGEGAAPVPPEFPESAGTVPPRSDFADFALLHSLRQGGNLFHCRRYAPTGGGLDLRHRAFLRSDGKTAVAELQFPDAALTRTLPPRELPPGKYRLTLDWSGEKLALEPPNLRRAVALGVKPDAPEHPLSISVKLSYATADGRNLEQSQTFSAQGECPWRESGFEFELPETGFAPTVSVSASPARESRLLIRAIRIDPVL